MGFIRAEIDYVDGKYVATMFFTWMVYGETTQVEKFDTLKQAKRWILAERTYNNLKITDSALCKISFKTINKEQNKKTTIKAGLLSSLEK